MPPDRNSETAPLLVPPPPPAQTEAVVLQPQEEGQTAATFLPVLGLFVFGVSAGWVIGHYQGSMLWIIPAIAIISGLTHRRLALFKKYLLHSIVRLGQRERVDGHMESVEWINLILERFWTVFEPQLSKQVIEKVNLVMEQQKPGFLDKLELREFTLGSNPPCVLGARGYSRTLPNIIHLDMDLCFYPAELSEESKQTIIRMKPSFGGEQPVQWNSKIVVVARVGKGFVGVDVPVMIKEVAFFGKLRVQLELMNEMPLLKQVQLTFLETPKIDFILRPLKALDLMDLPGLSNWMMSMINDNIEAQLVNPNRITINVAGTIDKIKTGVLKVKISSTKGLKFAANIEPFIKIELNGKSRGKTAKALEGDAIHGRFFILTKALTKPIMFHVMTSNQEKIGTASYPLEKLSEQSKLDNLTADVLSPSGEVLGQVLFSMMYVTAEDVLDPEADLNSETGIFSVHLKKGDNLLPVGKTDRKIYVEGWVHPKKIEHDPSVQYTDADPTCYRFGAVDAKAKVSAVFEEDAEWEVYLDRSSKTQVTLLIRDAETDEVYGKWTSPVKKLLNRSDWFTLGADGKINLAFGFRPTQDAPGSDELVLSEPAVGVVRLKIFGANNLEDKKVYYVTAEKKDTEQEIGRTGRSSETGHPVFNKTLTWPVSSTADIVRLEVYQKDIFKDPMVASLNIPILNASHHPNEIMVMEEPLKDKKDEPLTDGETIRYEIAYYPVAVSEERAALEASAAPCPLIPDDTPSDSNCCIFAIEQIAVKGLPLGQQPKGLYVEAQLEDDDEPFVKTIKGTESYADGVFTWNLYAEKFVKEPGTEELTIRLLEDKTIGSAETLATVNLSLDDGQSSYWYKTKSGVEVMIKATCKPVRMLVPTEAENAGVLTVNIQSARDLLAVDASGFSDPFAVVRLNANKVYKTEVIKKELNPEWNETFETDVLHRDRDVLNIDFRDWNRVSVSQTLGQINLDLSQLPIGTWQEMDIPLENVSTGTAQIRVKFETKSFGKKSTAAAIISAPSAAMSGVASGFSSFGSKIGDKMRGSKADDDEGRASPEKKDKGKVGSFFSNVGDKMTGSKRDKEDAPKPAASPVKVTKEAPVSAAPQPSAGPKAPTATVAAVAAVSKETAATPKSPEAENDDDEEPLLCIQFLELKVAGISKPFDTRIKVKQGDKTIFKTEEIKNSTTPNFRARPIQDTAFIIPEADPSKPIRFALNWSAKSDPTTPEVVFNPETMTVIEEREDSAIASLSFPINTKGVTASIIFKFAEADDAMVKSLKGSAGKMFSSLTSRMSK